MKRHHIYECINWSFIFISIGVLLHLMHSFSSSALNADHTNVFGGGIVIAGVITVYLVKMLRLYIALSGTKVPFWRHVLLFFKTAPVSILLPFKLGDVYRMYCYGYYIRDYIRSTVTVLLDRFVDTLALLTVIAFVFFHHGESSPLFLSLLILFLVFLLTLYFAFPTFYAYWNKYLIECEAHRYTIVMLECLASFKNVYQSIRSVIKGRFLTLYFLSLIAWLAELGCMSVVMIASGLSLDTGMVIRYLESALGIDIYSYQYIFAITSLVITIGAAVILYLFNGVKGAPNDETVDNL